MLQLSDLTPLHESSGLKVIGADFEALETRDMSRALASPAGYLVLNLEGQGIVFGGRIRLGLVPGTVALLRTEAGELIHASRLGGGGRQRFVVLSASPAWLSAAFGDAIGALHPALRGAASADGEPTGHLRSMSLAERDLCESLLQPPIPRPLRAAWFRGKGLECFSLFGAAPQRAGGEDPQRQRLDAATQWLREHFRDDLDLQVLARHVGCAPHYLSRLFKRHGGKTLSRKLREIRIDHAADLLRDGNANVTEAAFEVGYSSLSHFTKAFVAEKGVRPSEWRGR
jgi:AraC-like DNA-binding protein